MTPFIPHLTLVSADDYDGAGMPAHSHHTPPRAVFGYTVRDEHCNRMGNMHGGATATLFDFCTSLAQAMVPRQAAVADIADEEGREERDKKDGGSDESNPDNVALLKSWAPLGVSRTLAVTYVRPAPSGTAVLVECDLVHMGRRMSSLRGTLRRASDGAVLATCEHGKVIPDVPVSKV